MNAKHGKRRSDQVIKMSSTSFLTTSSVKNMKSTADAGKRRSSFRARVRCNAQFATVSYSHDGSSSISTSNSDKHFDMPKSGEFPSLVKFDVWFYDSLVHLPNSKSVHVFISARFHDALAYRTASVSQFSSETVQPFPENTVISFCTIILQFVRILNYD